jgi:hypothetical protein
MEIEKSDELITDTNVGEEARCTTEKEFKQFQKGFLTTQALLGIYTHEVRFYHCELNIETAAQLEWSAPQEERHDIFTINVCFNKRVFVSAEREPYKSGVHEALHMLLLPLQNAGARRYVSKREIKDANESIVVKLTSMIMGMKEEVSAFKKKYQKKIAAT